MRRILSILSFILLIAIQSQGQSSRTVTPPDATDRIIKLYPNPATDLVTVTANHEISKAEIFDELGRKVLSVTVHNNKQIQLNTKQLSKALYVIRLTGANGNCAIKFLKN